MGAAKKVYTAVLGDPHTDTPSWVGYNVSGFGWPWHRDRPSRRLTLRSSPGQSGEENMPYAAGLRRRVLLTRLFAGSGVLARDVDTRPLLMCNILHADPDE